MCSPPARLPGRASLTTMAGSGFGSCGTVTDGVPAVSVPLCNVHASPPTLRGMSISSNYGVSGDGGPGAEGELGRRRPAGLVRPDTRLDGSFASQTARSASPTLQPPKSVACRSTRESFKATGSGVSGFGGLGDGRPVSSATFSSSEGLGLRPSHLRAECFAGQNIGYLPE